MGTTSDSILRQINSKKNSYEFKAYLEGEFLPIPAVDDRYQKYLKSIRQGSSRMRWRSIRFYLFSDLSQAKLTSPNKLRIEMSE